MVSKVISISKKFNIKLNDNLSRLLYLLLIPHSDDFGRLSGDPYDIKALILPMMEDVTPTLVQETLVKLHNVELINWYEIRGERYIQIVNFDDHQQGLHKRTKSKFPEPPGHSGKFPEIPSEGREGKGTEEKRTETEENRKEGNGREFPATDSNPHKDYIHKLVNECEIQKYNLMDLDELFSYIGMVDIEVIEAAVKKSYRKESLRYAITTLKGMIKDGKTKKEHLFDKPTPGQAPAGRGRSGKPQLSIVSSPTPEPLTHEEMEEIRAMARKMDGAS